MNICPVRWIIGHPWYISRQRNSYFPWTCIIEHVKDNATQYHVCWSGEVQSFPISCSEFGGLSFILGHLTTAVGQAAAISMSSTATVPKASAVESGKLRQRCTAVIASIDADQGATVGDRCANGQPGGGGPRGGVWWEVDCSLLPGGLRCSALRPAGELRPWGQAKGLCLTRLPVESGPSLEVTVNLFPVSPVRLDGDIGSLHGSPRHRSPSNGRIHTPFSGPSASFSLLSSFESVWLRWLSPSRRSES